ncbi:TetR/AcrR family transcriptional regulator [Microbacterium xanthum]|uniref:TetR/AcrR family transcriptional regulator n=1 Tax=Microbacterium xanthum TaxID=3079794 RepID=UPI002AD278AD|nr:MULTISPECIES: TetR/AcrR family transcriptional regulator [unclassified Microbacterium]MDZ8173101.1 TetR/AcrR family transcriptional regulator [Microbacterium sp. KSW-48]MDZ8200741.1 TetR/AcrR family transcriptional regulator [Microbacterium sp. SSW1-59]
MNGNPARHANTRVGKDQWLRGAIDLIAEEGVGGLKIEPLARRLGITKGSFYWHFDDRADLIAQALDLWLQLATLDVIERLRAIADPEARLRALFTESFGELVDSPIDALLLAQVDDPTVGPVIKRAAAERVAFLEQVYLDLGLPGSRAAARARLTYAAYVGTGQLARALPPDASSHPEADAAYERELEILLHP